METLIFVALLVNGTKTVSIYPKRISGNDNMAHWWRRLPISPFDLSNIGAWRRRLCERPAYRRRVPE